MHRMTMKGYTRTKLRSGMTSVLFKEHSMKVIKSSYLTSDSDYSRIN